MSDPKTRPNPKYNAIAVISYRKDAYFYILLDFSNQVILTLSGTKFDFLGLNRNRIKKLEAIFVIKN